MKTIKIYLYRDLASYAVTKLIDSLDPSVQDSNQINIPLPGITKLKRFLRNNMSEYPHIEAGISKTIVVNTCRPIDNDCLKITPPHNKSLYSAQKYCVSGEYSIDTIQINNALEQVFSVYSKYKHAAKQEFEINNIQFIQLPNHSAKTVITYLYNSILSKAITEILIQNPNDQILIDSNRQFIDFTKTDEMSETDIRLLDELVY
jgi:hypothetical protein